MAGAVVAAAMVFLRTEAIAVSFAIIALAISWEWGCLNERGVTRALLHPGLLFLLLLYMIVQPVLVWIEIILYLATIWWTVMFVIVTAYQPNWRDTLWLGWLFRIGSIIAITAAWLAIVLLHQANVYDLLYLIGLVVTVDTVAYISGILWGRRKLMPDISPHKTYAGLWGALAGVLILSATVSAWNYPTWASGINFVWMSLLIAMVAIIGDFSESLLKRRARVKDSGFLLPGHGGLLDRADSFLAAAPIFVLIQY